MTAGADRLRPAWTSLPESLRAAALDVIGGEYISDAPAHGGFSATYAGTVVTTGGRAFVKAAGADWHADSVRLLRQEIVTLSTLPSGVAPRVLGTVQDDIGAVLVVEAIDGRHPGRPWTADDLHAVADALAVVGTTPAPRTLTAADESMVPGFTRWQEIAATPDLRGALPPSVRDSLPRLRELEAEFAGAVRGDVLVHDDVRADNILIADGRAHLLDWPHARRGAAWVDLPCVLPSIEASGGPTCTQAYPVFEEHGAPPPRDLLPVIAGFASYLWAEQSRPEIPQLPGLRAFQRAQAGPALRWLAALV
ncbi:MULTISPECIES: phosphotransferase [Microbacterium]|uniref:Aminoglycoside phosphotransferase family protein n=1 Tax=Microbacterium sufflavum TaxID=2851649 RepID=A0ABY4IHD7_9MICO|nr:phosphotransferase [Microbacterium sufflavum]UPL12165.1 aminoglycoside phosphotransferase family protein [Microbacterium sufflavum]